MILITWNCNGALRNKYQALNGFDWDVLVVQECEDPGRCKDAEYKLWASNYLWVGDSKNKGIGIFAKEGVKISPLDWSNTYEGHEVKLFLPCLINDRIQLLGVWTKQNNSPTFGYIGQLWKYLQLHSEKFEDIIIAGDLNSNVQWDKWDRWWNHTDVVNQLKDLAIVSAYHFNNKLDQGSEKDLTYFMHRKLDRGYHIDYVFASEHLLNKSVIKIGEAKEWIRISDHVPIIAHFNSI